MQWGLARRGPWSKWNLDENLRARTTKDLAEAKNTQTGNKPFKKGEYTDVVLDIIGGENSKALHGIQGVVGDGEPTIVEESWASSS